MLGSSPKGSNCQGREPRIDAEAVLNADSQFRSRGRQLPKDMETSHRLKNFYSKVVTISRPLAARNLHLIAVAHVTRRQLDAVAAATPFGREKTLQTRLLPVAAAAV